MDDEVDTVVEDFFIKELKEEVLLQSLLHKKIEDNTNRHFEVRHNNGKRLLVVCPPDSQSVSTFESEARKTGWVDALLDTDEKREAMLAYLADTSPALFNDVAKKKKATSIEFGTMETLALARVGGLNDTRLKNVRSWFKHMGNIDLKRHEKEIQELDEEVGVTRTREATYNQYTYEWADQKGKEKKSSETVEYWTTSLMEEVCAEVDLCLGHLYKSDYKPDVVPCIDYEASGFPTKGVTVLIGGDHGDKNCPISAKLNLSPPKRRKQLRQLSYQCPMVQFASVKCSKDTEDHTESTDAEPPLEAARVTPTPTPTPTPTQTSVPPITVPATNATEDTNRSGVRLITDGKKTMTMRDVSIKSNKFPFVIKDVPTTHVIVPKAHLIKLQRQEKLVKDLQSRFKRRQFPELGIRTKATIAVALASAPSLALQAAEYVVPTITSGLLHDTGLLDYKGYDHLEHAGSFPSEHYYRSVMYDIAAECLIAFGLKLKDQMTFIACDKGNKKGVGHFVKMISHWNEDTQSVDFKCLDMDASEGDTENCAIAIEFSMSKLGGGIDCTIKLQGQTTDGGGGGGGALDGLAKALKAKGLCRENYKTAPCTIHCFQLTLSNPTKKVLGEGGLNEQNLMQLLHSTYDMQEALDFDEYGEMFQQASSLAVDFQRQKLDPPKTIADRTFHDKVTKVLSFYDIEGEERPKVVGADVKTKVKKMPAPVLTRWWYVGKGCVFVFLHYVALLWVTQMAINIYLTAARVNKIASNLQALLLEQELFSDCALLYCHHNSFFDQHMKWLQDSRDVTERPGFQSHQILLRCCLMQKDLIDVKVSILTAHPGFAEFRNTIAAILSEELRDTQKKKADQFITLALASLNEHFLRWAGPNLLPAALISEAPFAKAVARQTHGMPHPPRQSSYERFYISTIHGRAVDVVDFERWLGVVVKPDIQLSMDTCDLLAAKAVTGGANPRDLVGSRDVAPCRYLWRMHLALASHTQGVEAAVEEARLVSTTGRQEQLRSVIAIVRSHLIASPGDGNLRLLDSKERTRLLLQVADELQDQHNFMVARLPDYKDRISAVRRKLKEEHFVGDRVDKLKARVREKGVNNKQQNSLQKQFGVSRTPLTLGLIPHSSIQKKRGHLQPLKEELEKRGVAYENNTNFKSLMKLLKNHEATRVEAAKSSTQAIRMSKKAFMQLSEATFEGVVKI